MNVNINNSQTPLPDSVSSVADLIRHLYPGEIGNKAIAINNRLVRRSEWDSTSLTEDDDITVISAAFGG